MADQPEPVLHCPTCYSTKFRLSKIRPEDRFQLLLFRYPVRCRKCTARIYAGRSYANYLKKIGQLPPERPLSSTDSATD